MRDEAPTQGGIGLRSRTYITDLTDTEWQQVQHLIEVKQTGPGPRRSVDLRAVLNAVRYKQHTGCQWRNLPDDMPPRSTVHGYYRRWNRNGVLRQIAVLLMNESVSGSNGDQGIEAATMRRWAKPRADQPDQVPHEALAST
jgi:transposase